MPASVGSRVALRANQDPSRQGTRLRVKGRPGLAFAAGIALRCGRFRGRRAPVTAWAIGIGTDRGIQNGFFRRFFVGRAAWFNTGQCSSLCYLQAAARAPCTHGRRLGENNTWFNSSRKSRRIPRGAPAEAVCLDRNLANCCHFLPTRQHGWHVPELAKGVETVRSGMVQRTVTLRRPNPVGSGLRPVPPAPERHGGRSLQCYRNA
jgi:hypothetical protein